MKIGCLGAGAWGFCLASLLSEKDYELIIWEKVDGLRNHLIDIGEHPRLPGAVVQKNMKFTENVFDAVNGVDLILESVTSAGVRPVFSMLRGLDKVPIVLSSKGIEQGTGNLLGEVLLDVLGEDYKPYIGCLSGPTLAGEIIKGTPASVVVSGYNRDTVLKIRETFSLPRFRVYPNMDIEGVEFGGAMKNIIALACGMSDGLGFGDNAKAALMTRGLHEIRKLAVKYGCQADTINGLSGMGDLCVTCMSDLSRNYRFGSLLARGSSVEEARKKIGAVIEGAYSCVSALELGRKLEVPLPITEVVNGVIYKGLGLKEAMKALLGRTVKEEHL